MRTARMKRKNVFALSLLTVLMAAVAFAVAAGSTGWHKPHHHLPKHKPAPVVVLLPDLDGNSIDTKQSANINFWNNVTNNTSVDFSESKYGDTALGCDCTPKHYGPYCYTCGSYGWGYGWGGYQNNSDRDGFDIDVINATTITNTALITQTNTPVIKEIGH